MEKFKELVTRYYLALVSIPIVGVAIHFVVHTVSHLFGIGGCP